MLEGRKLPRPPIHTPKLYEQDSLGNHAIVYAHYFVPGTAQDWYVTEFDSEKDLIFGWAELIPGFGEFGYSDLSEIESISTSVTLRINGHANVITLPVVVEYDSHWKEITIGEVLSSR